MASIHGFSLPDGFEAGASFKLSKEPWGDQWQDIDGIPVAIKSGQARILFALPQISDTASSEEVMELSLPAAQKFLDLLAVQTQLAYRIVNRNENVIWRRRANLSELQINATLPITTGGTATARVIRADGSIDLGAPPQSPKAQAAFRYYRFASSADDLFEAYRYLYLCLESALDDLRPRGQGDRERQWLGDALRQAKSKYSLDLSPFSTSTLDPVDQFIRTHYILIRCATFHGKRGSLMPGNLPDVEQVDDQLQKLQSIVRQLLKVHFGVAFRSSGMTPYWLNSQLEILIPSMWLATSPQDMPDLTQEVESALTSTGYYEALPKHPEDVAASTIEKLDQSVLRAQEIFPFDLVPVRLDGKRPGYEDEWIVTAQTKTDELQHSEIQSMALSFMFDQTAMADAFLLQAVKVLSRRTVSTNLDLTGIANVVCKLRIVLRYFQEFPKEFASH